MGDYILLVDADTRVPADCLLDAISEMQQDPNVAIMQFTTVPFMVCPFIKCCCQPGGSHCQNCHVSMPYGQAFMCMRTKHSTQ